MEQIEQVVIPLDQALVAKDLVAEILEQIDEVEELTHSLLLDVMGVLGVSFYAGEAASLAFIEDLTPAK
jgi:hypothetical protein